ncbi:hypothetical protein AB0I10_07640 [Streptomyces sp. NPDC050636]|uniref:hypothetical protein n=1 Tax=Streptomyces sp. NPDC050636 TaxID=3154510 RepID=UPI0034309DA8
MTSRTPGQDPVSAPSAAEHGSVAAVIAAVVDGSVLSPGSPARTTAFEALHTDPDGPVTHALIALTDSTRPAARRTALALLGELTFNRRRPWQGPIEAASARLRDPDPDVRRAAARLLVRAGGTDRVRTALDTLTDLVTRIALADALFRDPDTPYPPGPLRSDPLPEIRLLACVEELASAPGERWPELDAQAEAEVAALSDASTGPPAEPPATDADRVLTVGHRWAGALFRQGRETACYATATRLLAGAAGPYGQRVGADLARRAFQEWRAAPATLAPRLVPLLHTAPPGLRDLAVDTLCASRTATRATADDLAALLPTTTTTDSTTWTIAYALATSGDARAASAVRNRLSAGDPPPGAGAAVRGLLRSDALDPAELTPLIRKLLRSDNEASLPLAAHLIHHLGPAAAACTPDLINAFRATLAAGRDTSTRSSLVGALGRIGAPAAPAVPLLESLADDVTWRAGHVSLALSRITGDRAPIERYLHHLRTRAAKRRYVPDHSALFRWLLDHGGLDADQSAQLRTYVFARPSAMRVHGSLALWRHEGPAAAGDLLAVLPQFLDDDLFGPRAMDTLAAMGEHATPALPQLRDLIARNTRIPLNAGSADAEMRGDEQLLESARRTIEAITAPSPRDRAPAPGPVPSPRFL